MIMMRLAAVVCALAFSCVNSCTARETTIKSATETNDTSGEKRTAYVIDSEAGAVAGITVGMTEVEIRDVGWPFDMRFENLEGDEYKIYDLRLAEDVYLKCIFDLENTLYSIESSSPEVQDKFGLGASSELREVKRAYPNGRFIKGYADGRYANFLTGTRLIFRFDHTKLDESCFEYGEECKVSDSIAVQTIAIGRYAPQ